MPDTAFGRTLFRFVVAAGVITAAVLLFVFFKVAMGGFLLFTDTYGIWAAMALLVGIGFLVMWVGEALFGRSP